MWRRCVLYRSCGSSLFARHFRGMTTGERAVASFMTVCMPSKRPEVTMSKLRLIPYAVMTVGLFAGGGAFAQSMYDINQRQDYQQNRIEQGVRSGQITQSEYRQLEQGERAID